MLLHKNVSREWCRPLCVESHTNAAAQKRAARVVLTALCGVTYKNVLREWC
jgi:hypothetical protein